MGIPITYRTAPLFADLLPDSWLSLDAGRKTADRALASHYADLADFARATPSHAPKNLPPDHRDPWEPSNAAGFHGTASMAEAIAMARDGWPEGAERARKLRDGLAASLPVRNRMVRYDVAGSVPDVRRHLGGNPASMRRLAPATTTARPAITIAASLAVAWVVPAQTLEARAAAQRSKRSGVRS